MMETNFADFEFDQENRLASHPWDLGSSHANFGVRTGGYRGAPESAETARGGGAIRR